MYVAPGAIHPITEHSISIGYGDISFINGSAEVSSIHKYGVLTDFGNWSPITDTHELGGTCPGFARDYYGHIHLEPSIISLGNILSIKTIYIKLWNSFEHASTLTDLVAEGISGLTLEGPSPPTVFKIYEEATYKLTVDIAGDPNVNARYTFVFDTETVYLYVTGSRIIVWSMVPEADFIEIYEWKTDIIESREKEQRISTRSLPRRIFTGNYAFEDLDTVRARTMIEGLGARYFGYPVWSEAKFAGVLSAGMTVIPVDTSNTNFTVGNMAVIFQDEISFEAGQVLEVTSSSITIKQPLEKGYDSAYAIPLVFALSTDGITFSRDKDIRTKASITFEATDNLDIGYSNKVQLRGKDLLLDRSVLTSSLSERMVVQAETVDNMVGKITVFPKLNHSSYYQSIKFNPLDHTELTVVKKWLASLRGKQRSFFLPTWNRDFQPLGDVFSADTVINIHTTYKKLYSTELDILFVHKDGSTLLHKALSVVDGPNNTENLVLSSLVGRDFPQDELEMICIINHVRLDSDRVEIHYGTAGSASISLPVVGVPEL